MPTQIMKTIILSYDVMLILLKCRVWQTRSMLYFFSVENLFGGKKVTGILDITSY